ncbi:hypothetical protein HPB50_008716 [Hyalomma asiaticum]|uniref:Uncharacterized protein n=1 Tax=Hyalomma asiaticum TaxID=266040 RepID=A0ACB7TGN0_HYAAI|nr:hypothetical protein HPB50_008716 [Hyalomma asiaticum]
MAPNLGVAMNCRVTYPYSSTICHAATKFLFGDSPPSPHSRRQGFLPLPFRRGSSHRSADHTSAACSLASSLLDRAPEDSAAGVFRQLPSRPRGLPAPSLVRKLGTSRAVLAVAPELFNVGAVVTTTPAHLHLAANVSFAAGCPNLESTAPVSIAMGRRGAGGPNTAPRLPPYWSPPPPPYYAGCKLARVCNAVCAAFGSTTLSLASAVARSSR